MMMIKRQFVVAAVLSPLLLAGCGDGDQARVSELEGELAASREEVAALERAAAEVESLRTEVADLQRQLEERRAQATESDAAAPSPDTATLEQPVIDAAEALRETDDQLTRLEDALAAEGYDDMSLEPVRENLRTVGQSLSTVADAIGADLSAAVQAQ